MRMTLEQGQKRWAERKAKLAALQPSTFRGAMKGVHSASKDRLRMLVYTTPGGKSGNLARAEKLEWEGKATAYLVNDARAAGSTVARQFGVRTGGVYAWYVAEGHKAFVLPKRSKPYVFRARKNTMLRGTRSKRTGKITVGYVRAGSLVFSRGPLHIPEQAGRPWRKAAITAAQRLIPLAQQNATRRAMQ